VAVPDSSPRAGPCYVAREGRGAPVSPESPPMDVTCERCRTAYEFDDALVSERGTTVKCTNCGHQFKVRRAEPLGAPERWLVRTIDGREIEFRALRELQAAIAQSLITRDDVLSRGGARPRRLGSIAELEPFFAGAGARGQSSAQSTVPGLGARQRTPTPQGLGIVNMPPAGPRPSEVSVAIPLPKGHPGRDRRPPARGHQRPRRRHDGHPAGERATHRASRSGAAALRASACAAGQGRCRPAASAGHGRLVRRRSASADVRRGGLRAMPGRPPGWSVASPSRTTFLSLPICLAVEPAFMRAQQPGLLPGGFVPEVPLDAPSQAVPSPGRVPDSAPFSPSRSSVATMTPTPSLARASLRASEEGYNEPRFSSLAPPRRTGAARWIVGFVLLGMFALASVTLGRRFLEPTQAANGAGDERIGPLLQEGEKALLNGDLDAAQEQFAKASAFGEKDPKVLADLARLAAIRADISWLRVRLLPEGDPDLGTAKRELEQAADRLQKAAGLAAAAAPNDAITVRARIDALRVQGDLAGARKLVSGVSTSGAQPDNALVLAELDLAEDKPDWVTVLDRLRTALSGDQGLGRARALLVYALARSGDAAAARAELERLSDLPRPHPLLRPLRAFVTREPAAPDASAKAGPKASASAAPVAPPSIAHDKPADVPRPPIDKPVDVPRPPVDKPVVGNPPPSHTIDTSDLPGIKPPPPKATADTPPPPPPPIVPPGVDTSDLPGFK
jgi:predicted Zn finger-like uncharacterized protein